MWERKPSGKELAWPSWCDAAFSPPPEEEATLVQLTAELRTAVEQAQKSADQSLAEVEAILVEMRQKRPPPGTEAGRMSSVGEALKAVREALLLADKVKRTADATLELTKEVRDHDRRITALRRSGIPRCSSPRGARGRLKDLAERRKRLRGSQARDDRRRSAVSGNTPSIRPRFGVTSDARLADPAADPGRGRVGNVQSTLGLAERRLRPSPIARPSR